MNINKIQTILLFSIIYLSSICFAGNNDNAGCSIDMDITSINYENILSQSDIDYQINAVEGERINVAVVAQNVQNLDTYQVEIKYDNSKLKYIFASEEFEIIGVENLLTKNNGKTIGFQSVEKTPGIINIANTLIKSDTLQAPEGSGVIAVLVFNVIKNGQTTLELSNVNFIDSFGNEDKIDNLTNGMIE